MPKGYRQFSQHDRDRLSLLKGQGKSLREIAVILRRHVSTISRELKRNSAQWSTGSVYLPHAAEHQAALRKAKSHQRERLRQPGLKPYVVRKLQQAWSPERIAGRWSRSGRGSISHEAIYQWIYAAGTRMIPYLLRAHSRRRRHVKRRPSRAPNIPSRTPISQRPEAANLRLEYGHWEADTIVSRKSKTALQVLVERRARFVRLKKLKANNAASVQKSIVRALGGFPEPLRQSITYDNGSENTGHIDINRRLGTASYFCEPMHSWEKGSVENVAGLVRRWLPKKTDFASLSRNELKRIEHWLNSLPRKQLDYKTAAEAFRDCVALAG